MSSFKDLFATSAPKSFISESALAAQRADQIAAYRAQGKEPPAHLLHPESAAAPAVDFRPLADRLAEQRRIKEEELEAKLSLRNHVPMLDEDDSEYLNDVADQERREEVERRRRERLEVERFRAMQAQEAAAAAGPETGLDPETVIKVVAERAGGGAVAKSLVRELLLATDGAVEDIPSAPGSRVRSSFVGEERKRKVVKKGLPLVVPKSAAAAPSKRSASAADVADEHEEKSVGSAPVKKARTDASGGGETAELAAVPVSPPLLLPAAGGNGLVAYASDDDDE